MVQFALAVFFYVFKKTGSFKNVCMIGGFLNAVLVDKPALEKVGLTLLYSHEVFKGNSADFANLAQSLNK